MAARGQGPGARGQGRGRRAADVRLLQQREAGGWAAGRDSAAKVGPQFQRREEAADGRGGGIPGAAALPQQREAAARRPA